MVMLTDAAVSTLQRVLVNAGPQAAGLRIMVADGGCAGLKYEMGLEAAAGADDAVYEFGAVKVFVDSASRRHLDGVTVDYVESIQGGGFKFDNPAATSTCGCGKSFSTAGCGVSPEGAASCGQRAH